MTTIDTQLCLGCGKTTAGQLVCPGCGVVPSRNGEGDFFALFGLPQKLVLDLDDLSNRYYALSRRLHPDLFHDRPAAERAASLETTALVNRAYRTLKDPVRRGLYWLTLHGESLGRDNERVPTELATLVFEVQEGLEGLRAARRADGGGAEESEVRDAHVALRDRLKSYDRQLEEAFAASDAADGNGAHPLAEIKRILSELHYMRTLVRDVEKELEPQWTA